jgi:tetratricopeptide (TPR) repeat protein
LEAYRRAIDLDEDLDRAWFRQGHVLMRLGRNSEALKCFQKAAQLDPANSLYQQSLQDMGALTMNDLDADGLAANGLDANGLDMDDLAVDLQENMLDFSASSARPGR